MGTEKILPSTASSPPASGRRCSSWKCSIRRSWFSTASFDPANRYLITANYSTGALTTFQLQDDGSSGCLRDSVALSGPIGPRRVEQGFSHPHDVPFDRAGHFIVVPDKGFDRVFSFRIDANGKFIPGSPPFVAARSDSGPRHAAFHPTLPIAYVINELNSTMTTYKYNSDTGSLQPLQIVPMLPNSFTGDSVSAEIAVAPSGKCVYPTRYPRYLKRGCTKRIPG